MAADLESEKTALSTSVDGITIRHCSGTDEFAACVALQKEVWNFSDADLVPLRMFVVADKIGGQVIGAYDGSELAGFALSIPGSRWGHPYLHSHMLGVKSTYRDRGLGRRLKLAQRQDAVGRGFELMEWTFDPLEIKNAYLNLEKLGAIARRYTINQYGPSSSPLQGGLPTDRLVAEWWLVSQRVRKLLDGRDAMAPATQSGAQREFLIDKRITVPAAIAEWKAAEAGRARARTVHAQNRAEFLDAFSADLAVLGFERDEEGNGTYLLGHWDEDLSYMDPGPSGQNGE